MDQVFEDVSYGQNLLDVIRRKSTLDKTQQLSPDSMKGTRSLPGYEGDVERQALVDTTRVTQSTFDSESDEDS